MLVSGIKSRPVYEGLKADPYAKHHLLAAEGEGALAILDLIGLGARPGLPPRRRSCTPRRRGRKAGTTTRG